MHVFATEAERGPPAGLAFYDESGCDDSDLIASIALYDYPDRDQIFDYATTERKARDLAKGPEYKFTDERVFENPVQTLVASTPMMTHFKTITYEGAEYQKFIGDYDLEPGDAMIKVVGLDPEKFDPEDDRLKQGIGWDALDKMKSSRNVKIQSALTVDTEKIVDLKKPPNKELAPNIWYDRNLATQEARRT